MNRMADRIPVRYAILLSLFVMVVGLVWHAPAPAAAATAEPTVITSSTTSTPSPTGTSGTTATAEPKQSTQPTSIEQKLEETGTNSPSPTGQTPSYETTDETATPSGPAPSDGGSSSEGDSTGGAGGSDDGVQATEPPGGTGGGTTDGGTTNNGGSSTGGTPTGGTPTGGTGNGTDTGGVPPSTTPTSPQPAPSGTVNPDIPTVEVPSGGTGLPDPSQSPDPAPDADAGPTTPAAPAPDKETLGATEPKIEKIVLVAGDNKTPSVLAGAEVSAEIEGVDGDGKYRVVSGELPPGLMLDTKTGKITGTAQRVGTYSFTIEYASEYQSAVQNYTIKVAERPTHIEVPPLEPAKAGEPYKAVVLHTEGGVGPFTYKLKGSELGGTSEATTTLKTAPWVSGASHQAAEVLRGSSKLQDSGPMVQSVSDSEGGAGVVSGGSRVGNLPAGMRLEGGVLAGKPKPEAAGTYTFTVVSTDRYGSKAEQTMTITVLSEGNAVPITAGENANITSPAQLSDEIAGQAASAESDAGSAMLPLMFGLLFLGAGTAAVALRHRRTVGTHR